MNPSPTETQSPATPGWCDLHGVNASAAVAAIKDRAARRKAGDLSPDGRKLALVVEGGAMRGAVSAGGAVALGHLGFTDVFDEVYATSSGVMNASYFLSDQVDLGITIYFEDLTTGRFINPLRFWKVLDVDHVIDEVVTSTKPLDVARVRNSPSRFHVAVINKETGEGMLIDTRTAREPLIAVLKAAMSIPVLYNRTVDIAGHPCMDGGLHIPFPLQAAIDRGCTDILVLLSRPENYVSRKPSRLQRFLFDAICARGNAGTSRTFARHHLPSRAARDLAFGRTPASSPVNIATICTEKSEAIDRTTVNPDRLRAAAITYGRRTLRIFGAPADGWNLGPASAVAPV